MKLSRTLVFLFLLFCFQSLLADKASPQDYETVVIENQREKTEKEEKEKLHKAIAEERESLKKQFDAQYKIETRVYRPAYISAQTAKDLIAPELSSYHLLPFAIMDPALPRANPPKIWRFDQDQIERSFGLVILQKGEHYYIARQPSSPLRSKAMPKDNPLAEMMRSGGLALIKETAIADARTDSLLVTALPETHEKIRAIIERMDNVIKSEKSRDTTIRYRIEVALLRGTINGDAPTSATQALKIKGESVAPAAPPKTPKPSPAPSAPKAPLPSQTLVRHAGQILILDDISIDRDEQGLLVLSARYAALPQNQTQAHPEAQKRMAQAAQYREAILPMIEGVRFAPGPLLKDGKSQYWNIQYSQQPRSAKKETSKGLTLAARYGISLRDLETFGLTKLEELGKGIVYLAGEKGEAMNPEINFPGGRSCEIQYQDLREPYLIIKSNLSESPGTDRGGTGTPKKLIESTVFLELNKPTVLGLTNLREALILTLRWQAVSEIKE